MTIATAKPRRAPAVASVGVVRTPRHLYYFDGRALGPG